MISYIYSFFSSKNEKLLKESRLEEIQNQLNMCLSLQSLSYKSTKIRKKSVEQIHGQLMKFFPV